MDCHQRDLSRQLDRNKFPVMGRVWSMDAVAKNQSTDFYDSLLLLQKAILMKTSCRRTDDGLIQVTKMRQIMGED